ncbi:MAG: hypothetical protein HZR80_12560 [Candidatus Heimdallarchaeota archaeon]
MNLINELVNSKPQNLTYEDVKENLLAYGFLGITIMRKISKDHKNYQHNLANLKGQIYEAYIYENLYNWAKSNDKVDKFVLKGPYVKSESVPTGFGYDKNRLVYFSFDEQLAEFDGILYFDGNLVFIEITTSTSGSIIINDFVDDIKKKTKLLKELFEVDEVYSLVITPKKIISPRFLKLENCINWVIPNLKRIEKILPNLRRKDKSIQSDKNSKYIEAHELKIKDLKVNKRRKLIYRKFVDLSNYKINRDEFLNEYSLHWWCVNRIYLGSIPNANLIDIVSSKLFDDKDIGKKFDDTKRAVIGVKFQPNSKPSIELYLIPKKDYFIKFTTFHLTNDVFKKRKSVIRKSTILRINKPNIDPNDKQFWKKVTNLCENLDIPEFN